MREPIVVRLEDTEIVKFGPDATYQLILGDDEGQTPIRTGIQTSQPGYTAPMHSHPYMEVLHVLDDNGRRQIVTREAERVLRRLLDADADVRDVEVRRAGLAEAFAEITSSDHAKETVQ